MQETRDSSSPAATIAETSPAAVKFGAFTLDLQARRLLRNDTAVALPARAVDALAYLVVHRDRVVGKDEIIAAAWRDVAVTDDSLVHAISVIRRTLGDDPMHASFIETVPRRGYRFVGAVEVVTPAPATAGEALPDTPAAHIAGTQADLEARVPTALSSRVLWVAAALVFVVGAATVLYRIEGNRNESPGAVHQQQIAPPGTEIVSGGVVSPDGRHLAFVARDQESGRTALWLRALDEPQPRLLPDTESAAQPFFSADSRTIAYFMKGELVARDVKGGRARTIASVQGAPAGGTWGSDNVIVFAEWTTGLYAVPAGGGPISPLTRLDHTALDVAHAWPQFLPDGRHFLYQVISPDATRTGVYAGTIDARTSTRILEDASAATYVSPGVLLYLQRGMLMAEPFDAARLRLDGRPVLLARDVAAPSLADGNGISASRDILAFRTGATKQHLTWVNRAGVPQGSLDVPSPMFNFRVSPSGQYILAASSLTDATGVWLVDLERRHSTQLEIDGMAPLWSPDGASLAFTSRAGLDVYVRPSASTQGLGPVVSDQDVKVLNDWSSDRDIIYTRHDPTTKLDLWRLPLSGGGGRPLLRTPFNEVQARISPDGRWLAYVSDAAGSQEVYVRRYPALDEPRMISLGGGAQPQWRADQTELFYLSPDRSLMAVTMRPHDSSFEPPRKLFRSSIRHSPLDARDSYVAMPDGRTFLIDGGRDDARPPITVMLEWADGVPQTRSNAAAETKSWLFTLARREAR
jgi:DNA-binding winged helix-turn-helix (wHTH) protein/Tol biopolymer transport system component